MTDAIRFYWEKGAAELPLSAIPEGDRSPLCVPRDVVQVHVPAVVEQLALGRYVAAAWSADENLAMVLCHPNLAKGGVGTLLVNAAALPKPALQLGTWEEAPVVAGLFLRAFGGEAATGEECCGPP